MPQSSGAPRALWLLHDDSRPSDASCLERLLEAWRNTPGASVLGCKQCDKIDFEAPYPPLASGGFICYGEYPNIQHNLKALEDVWDYSYQHVPYYGTNTPIDECYECGFTGEFECTSKGFTCPKCGNHDAARVSVTRRVCGYLGSPDARPFNAGKQEEVKRRVKHLGNGQIG